ncbi:MAG: ankyrin repeat domain-containing protein [Planctomycetota bacterium]
MDQPKSDPVERLKSIVEKQAQRNSGEEIQPDADAAAASPLIQAAKDGDLETVKMLLDQGVDVNSREYSADASEMTPLMWAACRLLCRFFRTRYDTSGMTPLMWAACQGHASVVRLLLVRKANQGIKRLDGNTALDLAHQAGHADIVRLLRITRTRFKESGSKENSRSDGEVQPAEGSSQEMTRRFKEQKDKRIVPEPPARMKELLRLLGDSRRRWVGPGSAAGTEGMRAAATLASEFRSEAVLHLAELIRDAQRLDTCDEVSMRKRGFRDREVADSWKLAIRVNAREALERIDDATPILCREFRNEDPLIRENVVAGLALAEGPRAVEWLIAALEDPDEGVRGAATSSLESITGTSFVFGEQDPQKWSDWWQFNKMAFASVALSESGDAGRTTRPALLCGDCLSTPSSDDRLCERCSRRKQLADSASEEERQDVETQLNSIIESHEQSFDGCVAGSVIFPQLAGAGILLLLSNFTNLHPWWTCGVLALAVLLSIIGSLVASLFFVGHRAETRYRQHFPEGTKQRAIADRTLAGIEESKGAGLHARLGIKYVI